MIFSRRTSSIQDQNIVWYMAFMKALLFVDVRIGLVSNEPEISTATSCR